MEVNFSSFPMTSNYAAASLVHSSLNHSIKNKVAKLLEFPTYLTAKISMHSPWVSSAR